MENLIFGIASIIFLVLYTTLVAVYGGTIALSMVVAATMFTALSQYLAQSQELITRRGAIICTYIAGVLYIASLLAFLLGG